MALSNGVIFDSNVWIAYFHSTDAHHTKATALVEKYRDNPVIITEYVLLEIATLLKQKIGPAKTRAIITTVLQTDGVELLPSSNFFTTSLAAFQNLNEKYLSFVDVSLLVLSNDFTVVTFDTQLHKAIAKV
jgi:predicted nucleic acid-binding protein